MEKNLTRLFSKSLPSSDLVVFVSVFFSIGFTSNVFSNLFYSFVLVSNTIFTIGVLGFALIIWKWDSILLKNDEKIKSAFYLYIILFILFCFVSYFLPWVFLISAILVISLILTINKQLGNVVNEDETLLSDTWLKIIYVVLTFTFYLVELAPDINERMSSKYNT
ncbi:MAG: hypothetical protein PWP54_120 [Thermosipho sp. (in: thermotogales)]|nr:hypothetical protein [Thermosipho sp. (in: thermotogales)]MDN5324411.1 hypothetical protein [Thermosipho sp. (in: thermotogales)]